ncbi:MAG: 30S ribosomal protein S6 [Bacilli bacterium]|nr:30S ribosomal protein S6 [Bacilli bacterium]
MKTYEIMYIIRTTIAEDEVKKVAKSFEKVLTDNGAKITDVTEMGQRELAYEIKDYKSGFYYVITINANDDKAINEFDRLARNSKDVIRHLITKKED